MFMRPALRLLSYLLISGLVCISFNSCHIAPDNDAGIENEENENPAFTIEQEFLQEYNRTKDPVTGTVPRERLLQANEQVKAFYARESAITGINWVEQGPTNVGGRTRAILFDANDATHNTLFAGGVSGGIWKCTNLSAATPTWTKVSDVLDNIAISCIVQDPTTPSNLYFGTGEIWGNVDALRGLGIWKSSDGGATWNHIASTGSSQFTYVQNIVITSYAIFAATGSGLQKSTDGGNTWTTVLVNSISDLQLAANGDLYASNFLGNIYKSTSGQQGASGTWTNLSLPGTHQRLKLAAAPSDANKLYVICQGAGSQEVDAIYRTDDGGATWNTCALPTVTDQGSSSTFARGQAWYDLSAAVDPNSANTVIIGAIDALRSTDGGATWNQITCWALPVTNFTLTVHSDQHIIVFSPGSSAIAVWGCDGGIYYTGNVNVTPNTTKPTFKAINTGYDVTQFYCGDFNPTSGSYYFLAGAQDNGTQKFSGGSSSLQSTTSATGGDGAFCHIDQTTPANQIASYVYSVYYLSTNTGASFSTKINDQAHGTFINPSDYDPATKVMYSDYTTVSTGAGGSFARWLTTGSTNTGVSVPNFSGASVTNVYCSPNVAKRVYFGLSNGSVVYVNNANAATNGTASTIIRTGVGSVSGIAIEPGNENHVLVTYSNYGVTSVWETTDGGTTWTSVEGNLPDMPVRWVIFNPNNADQALLATELGVWSTDNLNGTSTLWAPTNAGLANTRVDMLKVRASDKTILAVTHGRGLFTTTLTNIVLPSVYFEKSAISVAENGGTTGACSLGTTSVPVNLYLTSAAASDVTVQVSAAANSTATNGTDYVFATNTATFPAGTTGPQTIYLTVKDDNSYEGNEFINLNYTITAGGTAATTGNTLQSCQVEIVDNETPANTAYVNTVNSGTQTATLGGSSPVDGTQTDKKCQYLYSASDLSAAGLKAGSITAMSFTVTTKASSTPFKGFTILMGPTAATDLSAGFATSGAWTTVTSGDYSTVYGINQFTIPGGYTWDGTSNILIQFCFDNSTTSSSYDVTTGEGTSYVSQAKKASTTASDAGCSYTTATAVNVYRPVITFTQTIPQTTVATALNSTDQAAMGPNATVYYYDASGEVMASIQNNLSFDYGCTTVTIDRAGTGATAFTDNTTADYLLNKTFHVVPTTNNPSGQYTITLYYTAAEKAGWEAATGNSWSNVLLIKTPNPISLATPANPTGAGTIEYVTPVRGTFGTDYTLSYTFNDGFSGFGAGIPQSALAQSLLDFSGLAQGNTVSLGWTTSFEQNTRYYTVERSADGYHYDSIGTLPAQVTTFSRNNYHFTDPQPGTSNYYRLEIVNGDGRITYSKVVQVDISGLLQRMSVLDNPFSSVIRVSFAQPVQSNARINLYDATGRLLLSKTFVKPVGILALDVSKINLAKGSYLIQCEADRKVYNKNVIKR